jgi:hypothetical protein
MSGVTIEEEWTNLETVRKTATEASMGKGNGTLGMDGSTMGVNKWQQKRVGNTRVCSKENLLEQLEESTVGLEGKKER